ncbi:guanine nucleotide-binding protein-like 3-like protein [Tanacetum coccineum]|uniref:Guanine nucleotide-binding protein-like 3-like protein n=1 Tax=Tanacetum coccineum TaxID=301880 RepID=A0ABQ5BMT2_9ASTR
MESTLLSSPRFISTKSRESCGIVRQFQSSFSGSLIANTQFTRRTNVYTNHRISTNITSLFSLGKKKAKAIKRETIVPEPDYRIPIVFLGLAGGLVYQDNLIAAAPVGLLGLLLLFQTTRVRFVFDDEALEVKVGKELEESGENVFVGGKNRWKYSSFINWELWWPNFPILVYFKEAQTKPEGQVHFFPVIFNGKQLYDIMVERAGPSKTSGPK